LEKQITLNVLIKSGLLQTPSSGGISVYSALSDFQLARTQIRGDNKPIRDNQNNFVAKMYGARQFDTSPMQGFLNFSFDDSQNPMTSYRGDGLAGGSTFEVRTDIATANAQNFQTMIQEYIIGGNFPPLRPSV
jgi:hypothetical protein